MTRILHIDASAHYDTSQSRKASAKLVAELGGDVTYRDVTAEPLPFVDAAWADARLTDPATRSDADKETLALSDTLIKELQDADTIVIGDHDIAGRGCDGPSPGGRLRGRCRSRPRCHRP